MRTVRHWLYQKLVAFARANGLKAVAREFGCSRNTVRKWLRRHVPGKPSALGYGNGTFIAAADAGAIVTSTDVATWVKKATKASRDLWAVAYGHSTFVITGYSGTILQSDDYSIPVLAGQSMPGGFQVSLTGEIGRAYRVLTATNLAPAIWTDLFSLTNNTWTTELLDASATNFQQRFFRAVTP